MTLIYLAALAALFVYAFWGVDVFTTKVVHTWNFENFREIFQSSAFRGVIWRTIWIAAAVTTTCAVIGTTFTAGVQNTLPIWIVGNIRLGQKLPEVNVVVFLILLATIIPVTIAQRLTRESGILRTE